MTIIVHPNIADIGKVHDDMPHLVSFIERLLSSGSPEEIAHKASTAYLALIIAFERKQLMEVDFAPRLVIDIDNHEFEVSALL